MVSVRQGDRPAPVIRDCLPVAVVLDRLRSAYNVGNLFRIADAVRVRMVYTCGYTASPPHPKLAKTAMGTDSAVPCQHCATAAEAIRELKVQGYRIYAVETTDNSAYVWEAALIFPAAFVFGNEALGVSGEALALCDEFVSLPAEGIKNSINVGNCAAVVLFEAWRQFRGPASPLA